MYLPDHSSITALANWTTQDIVGLYCIRFSLVCIFKARVLEGGGSWSPPLLLMLQIVIVTSLTPNPRYRHNTKLTGSDRALSSNSKLSAFSCPPTASLSSKLSGSMLDTSNSSKSGKLHMTFKYCYKHLNADNNNQDYTKRSSYSPKF